MADKQKDSPSFEERLMNYSEIVGRLLGTAEGRAERLLSGGRIEDNLTRIRDGASELLAHLKPSADSTAAAAASGEDEAAGTQTAKSAREANAKPVNAKAGLKKSKAVQTRRRSGGVVDAPGKKHRQPPPSARGVKHSDQRIARAQAAATKRRPNSRG